MNRKHLTSSTVPGNGVTAPLRIVLHESHVSTKERPEWVTHIENMQQREYMFSGQYFRRDGNPIAAYTDALSDYVERCHLLGVDPMPEAVSPDLQSFINDAVKNTKELNADDGQPIVPLGYAALDLKTGEYRIRTK